MEPSALQIAWFLLIAVLIGGYAVLDGFDLGAGILHLFRRKDRDRRVIARAIGPVWDGNEVWLITGGGALFAAFPSVYATVFSGLYLALFAVLAALIARAAGIEFRSKETSPGWVRFWDLCFGLGSLLPALLLGVAVGNILRGLPIDARGFYTGTFLGLLSPYALLIGILSLVMFICHGALYLAAKTDGEFQSWLQRVALRLWIVWVLLHGFASFATALVSPWLFSQAAGRPLTWVVFLLFLAALLSVPLALRRARFSFAFSGSSVAIASAIVLAALGLYPRLVPSRTHLDHSLTIANASASTLTLKTMFIVALIGMPIVIGYTIYVYRVFRGKVQIEEGGY
ncbi:MAG: cytochrome d ubiquinol oxidase subunit II [Candidatus Eisenbacteria bacterium]|nr:cytochrome d ubiquinol oxidase subunit II [Candidatus Eisenbacteria bacterium]